MIFSREQLLAESTATGFRPEILEKVMQLLSLLETFERHPFLKGRLALKGGTALNLFCFDIPRLSVDMDLNYIGSVDRTTMLEERPRVEQAIQAVCAREGMAVTRLPEEHAGGKWRLRYPSSLSESGNLAIDLNYMFRLPLWPIAHRNSRQLGTTKTKAIPLLDLHELAAGKIAAMLARRASRDLFDTHLLLTTQSLNIEQLRLGLVVYGAMNRKDWRTVSLEDIGYDAKELASQLIPVVRRNYLDDLGGPEAFGSRLVSQCRVAMQSILPLSSTEREFLDRLLEDGDVVPSLLTSDEELAGRIACHPGLQWKAIHVREHKAKKR